MKAIFSYCCKRQIVGMMVFMASILGTAAGNSQGLDSLIREALHNNPQLKSYAARTDAAEWRTRAARGWQAPTLGVEFAQVPFSSPDLWGSALSNSISLSQMVMIGGKRGAMANVEQASVDQARANLAESENDLVARLLQACSMLWLQSEKTSLQKENIALLGDLLRSLLAGYQANQTVQADLLTLEGELAIARAESLVLAQQYQGEMAMLKQLLGRSPRDADVELRLPEEPASPGKPEGALERHPALQAMDAMTRMKAAMQKANRKELIPDLMVQGMVMRMPRGMILTSQSDLHMAAMNEAMYSIMISTTLPFAPWSKSRIDAMDHSLAAEIKAAEFEKEAMVQMLSALAAASDRRLETLAAVIERYKWEIVPAFTAAAAARLDLYRSGQVALQPVLDAQKMVVMKKMDFAMAQADYAVELAANRRLYAGN